MEVRCCDCGKKLKDRRSVRCGSCSKKGLLGVKSSGWKGGKPQCCACGILLKSYKSKKCRKCSNVGRVHSIEHRNKCRDALKKIIEQRGSWGFPKGHLPWHTGKKRPDVTGERNHFWRGGKLEKICRECEKPFFTIRSHIKRGFFCSKNCFIIWQLKNAPRGEKHYNWKGGVTPEINKRVKSLEWIKIRAKVYARDGYKCQICKKHCHTDIQCHHIIPYRISKDNNLNNLITLCKSCHIKEDKQYPNGRFSQS